MRFSGGVLDVIGSCKLFGYSERALHIMIYSKLSLDSLDSLPL